MIDVLAVGQSEQVGPATLTLLSVERYRDGFLAQFRLLQEYTPPEDPSSHGFPELVCEAGDERGVATPRGRTAGVAARAVACCTGAWPIGTPQRSIRPRANCV